MHHDHLPLPSAPCSCLDTLLIDAIVDENFRVIMYLLLLSVPFWSLQLPRISMWSQLRSELTEVGTPLLLNSKRVDR